MTVSLARVSVTVIMGFLSMLVIVLATGFVIKCVIISRFTTEVALCKQCIVLIINTIQNIAACCYAYLLV